MARLRVIIQGWMKFSPTCPFSKPGFGEERMLQIHLQLRPKDMSFTPMMPTFSLGSLQQQDLTGEELSALSGEKLVRKRKRDDGTETWTGNKDAMTKSQYGPQLFQKKRRWVVAGSFSRTQGLPSSIRSALSESQARNGRRFVGGQEDNFHTLRLEMWFGFACEVLPRGPGQVDYRKTDRELFEDISVREMILLHLGSCNPQEIDWSTVDTWDALGSPHQWPLFQIYIFKDPYASNNKSGESISTASTLKNPSNPNPGLQILHGEHQVQLCFGRQALAEVSPNCGYIKKTKFHWNSCNSLRELTYHYCTNNTNKHNLSSIYT